MHKGYTVDQIHDLTKIDKWFLEKLKHIRHIPVKKGNLCLERWTTDKRFHHFFYAASKFIMRYVIHF